MWGEADNHLKPRSHTLHLDSESGSVGLLSKDRCTLWTFPGVTVAASWATMGAEQSCISSAPSHFLWAPSLSTSKQLPYNC